MISIAATDSLSSQRQLHLTPIGSIDQDKFSIVSGAQLIVGVQQFDAIDLTIRRQIDVQLVTDANGLDLRATGAQAQIRHVMRAIERQFHRMSSK